MPTAKTFATTIHLDKAEVLDVGPTWHGDKVDTVFVLLKHHETWPWALEMRMEPRQARYLAERIIAALAAADPNEGLEAWRRVPTTAAPRDKETGKKGKE